MVGPVSHRLQSLRWFAAALMLVLALPGHATIQLGDARVNSTLGEALNVAIPLHNIPADYHPAELPLEISKARLVSSQKQVFIRANALYDRNLGHIVLVTTSHPVLGNNVRFHLRAGASEHSYLLVIPTYTEPKSTPIREARLVAPGARGSPNLNPQPPLPGGGLRPDSRIVLDEVSDSARRLLRSEPDPGSGPAAGNAALGSLDDELNAALRDIERADVLLGKAAPSARRSVPKPKAAVRRAAMPRTSRPRPRAPKIPAPRQPSELGGFPSDDSQYAEVKGMLEVLVQRTERIEAEVGTLRSNAERHQMALDNLSDGFQELKGSISADRGWGEWLTNTGALMALIGALILLTLRMGSASAASAPAPAPAGRRPAGSAQARPAQRAGAAARPGPRPAARPAASPQAGASAPKRARPVQQTGDSQAPSRPAAVKPAKPEQQRAQISNALKVLTGALKIGNRDAAERALGIIEEFGTEADISAARELLRKDESR